MVTSYRESNSPVALGVLKPASGQSARNPLISPARRQFVKNFFTVAYDFELLFPADRRVKLLLEVWIKLLSRLKFA